MYSPQRSDPEAKQFREASLGDKPFGFSWFPGELVPMPRSWIEKMGNMVHFSQHDSGGHFAAMEKPAELLADVEAFVGVAWKGAGEK